MKKKQILITTQILVVWLALSGIGSAFANNAEKMDKMNDSMTKEAMMDKQATGILMGSEGHNATGKVSFTKDMKDRYTLTLSDIEVDKVPDGKVYLAHDGDHTNGIKLGLLKQFSGTVSFALPEGVEPGDYNSVVIWCDKFNVEIGRAFYVEQM